MLAGFELRRRWRRVVLLAILVGIVGALVLSTMAGARRTRSALDRFNASSRSAELEVTVGDPTAAQLEAFGRVKGVAAFAPLQGIALLVPSASELSAVAVALDHRFGTVVDRARVVSGRSEDPAAPNEVTISETLAAQLHLRVGDDLDTETYSQAQIDTCIAEGCSGDLVPDGPGFRLQIVGITRRPLDLGDRGASGGVLVLTPAFARQNAGRVGSFGGDVLRVRTRHGVADVAKVAAAARRIFGEATQFGTQDLAIDTQGAQSAIEVLTVALWVFAAVAALAGLVAIAIVLQREISLVASDQKAQRALGLTRGQRIAVGGFLALPVAVGGAVIAVVGAAASSPLFPIGVARRAEPHLGFRVDGLVLVLGAAAVVLVILVVASLAALRATRDEPGLVAHGRAARLVDAANRMGVTPVATAGVRMAVEPGRGQTAVPVRSAMIGAAFGIVGVVAVLMFSASVDQVAATPLRYGWNWNFAMTPAELSVTGAASPVLRVPGVAAMTEVDTVGANSTGIQRSHGDSDRYADRSAPRSSRATHPEGPGEIALGRSTLRELHKHVGDTVHADGPDGSHDYRIVGRAVFPHLDEPQPLANGAALTGSGLGQILSRDDPENGTPYLVVRTAPGANVAAVERQVAGISAVDRPFGPTIPVEVDRLRRVNWLTATLAVLVIVLALLAVGHALVTSVRRRRRDLAVLKTLGFVRRQIRGTVAWQATTLATVGLIVGVPIGVIVRTLVWRQVADGLGVSTTPPIPGLAIALVIPGTLVATDLLGGSRHALPRAQDRRPHSELSDPSW